ncbi:DUF6838 family protein [Cohnella sp. GCM10020058]|uniref:phage tail terminator family protein n=1 Tax=Cohnella sp. GCM10020058 TaxID=3317330 RepID=UPI003639E5A9
MSVEATDLRQAAIEALASAFEGIPVYGSEPGDSMEGPYLVIPEPTVTHYRIMGNRYRRQYVFSIRYAAAPNALPGTLSSAAELLCSALEYIPFGSGHAKGRDMRYDMTVGILYFTFVVNVQLIKQIESAPLMAQMTMKERMK